VIWGYLGILGSTSRIVSRIAPKACARVISSTWIICVGKIRGEAQKPLWYLCAWAMIPPHTLRVLLNVGLHGMRGVVDVALYAEERKGGDCTQRMQKSQAQTTQVCAEGQEHSRTDS
jgi:hypothetical protein